MHPSISHISQYNSTWDNSRLDKLIRDNPFGHTATINTPQSTGIQEYEADLGAYLYLRSQENTDTLMPAFAEFTKTRANVIGSVGYMTGKNNTQVKPKMTLD